MHMMRCLHVNLTGGSHRSSMLHAQDNMRVSFLDWSHAPHGDEPVQPSARRRHFRHTSDIFHSHKEELLAPAAAPQGSLLALQEDILSSQVESAPVVDDIKLPQDVKIEIQSTLPPMLDDDEKFDVIIGSDLLYEVSTLLLLSTLSAARCCATHYIYWLYQALCPLLSCLACEQ